ncbi:DNA-directed RNA polymerase 3 largest subunit [Plasmodium reichenowi]|uniref:DNA-directed RNA polymerase subunit n=1 Tax=Plasmodium reichenowi TaxID=5854 RepID=A0A2P9DLM6_PLARE|nr:DNA-directed RNA polymerase 3 largest subunit [Plasmodium reichenowi]
MMKKKNIDIEELKRLIEESSMKKRFVKDIKRNCEIKSIRFGIMSKEDIIKYSEVKIMNREMYKNNSGIPYPYGVLDLKLGAHKSNSVCETCNKKLINCSGHFGYIELNYPVFHIGYYKYIIHILYCICKYCSSLLLSKEKIEFYCNLKKKSTDDSFYKKHLFKRILNNCKKVNKCYICGNPQGVIKKIIKPSLDQFMKLKHILKVKENGKMIIKEEDLNSLYVLKLFKNINPYHVKLLNIENPEKLIITALLVPPNTIRPSVIIDEHGTAEDDLTCILSEITQLNNTIYNQCTNGYQTNQFLGNVEFLQLQITRFINSDSPAVSQLLATQNISKPGRGICQRLKGKEGRFRCNLSGKRVDFSSRTVISPDPNISIDEVVIPKIIAMRLTYPETVNKYNIDKLKMLIKNGCNKWPGANYIIKKSKKGIDPYSDISTTYNNNNISSGCSNIFNVVNNYINNNCKNVRYNIKDVNNNVLKDMYHINNMNNDINNNINNIYNNTSQTSLSNVNNHNNNNNNNNMYCNNQTQDNEEERKNSQFNKISLKYANKNHVIQNLNIGDVVERHICDGDIVLFNRQPSLHRMSIMCHKAKIMDFKTFRFNECVCSPYNADFDGDEMNLHVPQTEEARAEALYLMNVKHNLITPKNGEVIIALTQDFLSASYIITNKDTFLDRDTFCLLCSYFSDASLYIELPIPAILKPKELWTGKQLISVLIKPNKKENTIINFEIQEREYSNKFGDLKHLCLNDSYVCFYKSELICGSLGKKVLGSSKYGLFYYLIHHNSSHIALKIMNRLSKLTSRYFSNKGMTIGIDDVRPSQTLTEKKKDLLLKGYEKVNNEIILYNEKKMQIQPGCTLEETLEIKVKSILDDLRNDAGKTCNQYLHYLNKPLIMFNSGAKGALINIAQMIACVGQQNVAGQRIQNGFINRTLPHFHFHCKDSESRGFVQNSFYTGLSPTEFFFHTMSGREGLVDTAVKTAETGYMQRRLMKALEDLSIHYDYSVRSCDKQIVQFIYGDDALNPSYIDNNNTYLDQFDKVFDHIVSISSSHLLLSYKNKIPNLAHLQHQNKTSNKSIIYNNKSIIHNNKSIIHNNKSIIHNNDNNMNSIHNNTINNNNNYKECTHNPYVCNESLIIRNIINRLIYQNVAQEDLFIPLEHDEFLVNKIMESYTDLECNYEDIIRSFDSNKNVSYIHDDQGKHLSLQMCTEEHITINNTNNDNTYVQQIEMKELSKNKTKEKQSFKGSIRDMHEDSEERMNKFITKNAKFFLEKKKGKMHECNDNIECNNIQCNNIQCNNIECNNIQCNNIQCNNISCNYMKSSNLKNTHHQLNNDLSFIKNNAILPPQEYHSIFHFVNDYRNVVEIKNLMDKKKIFLNNSEKNVVQSKYNRMSKNLKKKIEIINNIYRNEKKKLNRWKTKMDNDDNYWSSDDDSIIAKKIIKIKNKEKRKYHPKEEKENFDRNNNNNNNNNNNISSSSNNNNYYYNLHEDVNNFGVTNYNTNIYPNDCNGIYEKETNNNELTTSINICDKNNDFSEEFFNNINENDLLYDNKYYRQIFKNVIGFVSVFEYVESYKQHYILFPYEIIKWTSFLLEYLTEIIPTNIFLHTKLSKKEKPTHQKNTGKMKIYIEEIKKWLFIKAINIYKYFSFKKCIELIKKKDYFNYIIKNYNISYRYIIHDYSFINLKQLYLFIFFNIYKYFKYISTPGDAVGSISAQSIGEPGTQMTLKTFHFAGVASMNVTLGVPRIKEIINASNSIQTPILNIPLEVNDNYNFALMMKSKLEKTTIRDICMYIKEDYTSRGVFLSVKFNEELIQKLFLNINAYNIKDIILKQSHINKIKINKIHINVINKYKLHISLKNDEFIFFQMESLKKGLLDLLIYGDKDIKRCIIKKEDIEVTDNEGEICDDMDEYYNLSQGTELYERKCNSKEENKTVIRVKKEEIDDNLEKEENIIHVSEKDCVNQLKSEKKKVINDDNKINDTIFNDDIDNDRNNLKENGSNLENVGEHVIERLSYKMKEKNVKKENIKKEPNLINLDTINLDTINFDDINVHNINNEKIEFYDEHLNICQGNKKHIQKKKKKKTVYSILVEGNSLNYVLGLEGVDFKHIISNHVINVFQVLGIEAARITIINEIKKCVEAYSIDIDIRHIMLLADIMAFTGDILGINRFGIQKARQSTLMLASFEETNEHLFVSSFFKNVDEINNISESIIVGKNIPIGTGAFQLLYDYKFEKETKNLTLLEKAERETAINY